MTVVSQDWKNKEIIVNIPKRLEQMHGKVDFTYKEYTTNGSLLPSFYIRSAVSCYVTLFYRRNKKDYNLWDKEPFGECKFEIQFLTPGVHYRQSVTKCSDKNGYAVEKMQFEFGKGYADRYTLHDTIEDVLAFIESKCPGEVFKTNVSYYGQNSVFLEIPPESA